MNLSVLKKIKPQKGDLKIFTDTSDTVTYGGIIVAMIMMVGTGYFIVRALLP